MKKHMLMVLLILCSLVPGGFPQERADVVEAVTPSSAMLFIKTSRIKNFVVSVKFVADNLLHREYAEKFARKINEIKTKTGVDPMDIESLKKAGIDVDRTASMAMYPEGKKNEERMLLFIPVLDEKTFPLKFVEILKKMAGTEKLDLFPAITEYHVAGYDVPDQQGYIYYRNGWSVYRWIYGGAYPERDRRQGG